MRRLALFFTGLFHPLLVPTYGCILLLFGIKNTVYDYMTPLPMKWRITMVVFLFSFVLPVINIYLLFRLRRIKSLQLSERNDRTYPYILTGVFYLGLFYLMTGINIWHTIRFLILGGGIAILLTALVNLKTKISAHMVGLGGLLGALISTSALIKTDMTLFYIPVIIVAGLTAWARMLLGEHNHRQIYLGFGLGLIVQTSLFFMLQKVIFN
jgi:hypothetical protein